MNTMGIKQPGLDFDAQGWSKSGALITQSRNEVVGLQANFKKTQNFTVMFNLNTSIENVPVVLVCEAEITMAVEGNTIRRVITVTDGASITLTAQAVEVRVRDFTIINPVGAEKFRYQVSITVTPGTRGSFSNPPILVDRPTAYGISPMQQIVPGGFVSSPIPQNSGIKTLSVLVSAFFPNVPIPEQEVQVIILDRLGVVTLTQYDPRMFQWVPLPQGAGYVQVWNFTLGTNINSLVIFGIDG